MNPNKFTQGNWYVSNEWWKPYVLVNRGDKTILIVDCSEGEMPDEEKQANAELIASAPELYKKIQNSVSKEHYDELKLNYDIMVEENKRLNERERELVEALQKIVDLFPEKPKLPISFQVLEIAKAALSNHKK